jgi:Uma2 family endonuclease
MSEPARHWISVSEYLYQEERAEVKSEYFNGEVFAMAGGTSEHNLIAANLLRELGNQLAERPCLVYGSDQQVKVGETGLHTYPDITAVCAAPEFEDNKKLRLLNPTLIIEVLSPSTAAYDRGDKFAHYQCIPSLQEYVLVASDKRRIERFSRREGGDEWLLKICYETGASVDLPSIRCSLDLDRVYLKVELPEGEPSLHAASDVP